MDDKPQSGDLFGIPYNFERPSVRRLLDAHWQPEEEMLVEKPFGIGYTLNLANWRSWVVLSVVAVLLYQERGGGGDEAAAAESDNGPVEVVVDD
ncbi:MAG: DUF5808 domain-containing protein [Halolamina sp.]